MSSEHLLQKYARLAKTEPGVSRVGWVDTLQQAVQFEVMLDLSIPAEASVLDAGCGVGDLLGVLVEDGFSGPYTGIDLLPDFVTEAESRFSDRPATRFWTGDVADFSSSQYDFVFASGLFDYKGEVSLNNFRRTVTSLFNLTQKVLVFNGYYQLPPHRLDMWAVSLDYAIALCQSLSPYFKLRVDYAPGHFTAFIFKRAYWLTPQMQKLIGHLFLDRSLISQLRNTPQSMASHYGVTLQQLNLLDSL